MNRETSIGGRRIYTGHFGKHGIAGSSNEIELQMEKEQNMESGIRGRGVRLSFSQKLSRLAVRLKNPEWRRYAALVFGGKALGIAVLMLIITVISGLFLCACLRR